MDWATKLAKIFWFSMALILMALFNWSSRTSLALLNSLFNWAWCLSSKASKFFWKSLVNLIKSSFSLTLTSSFNLKLNLSLAAVVNSFKSKSNLATISLTLAMLMEFWFNSLELIFTIKPLNSSMMACKVGSEDLESIKGSLTSRTFWTSLTTSTFFSCFFGDSLTASILSDWTPELLAMDVVFSKPPNFSLKLVTLYSLELLPLKVWA
ncbi:hypothetical protein WICPIJ_008025 [Wickerhamomyces pijperi]|uniref:Uncharacterized protein n=1 Tax=Wickerhamomyces pijperi TaxID=599730 RepID=A0A9P8PYQ0_WICPI|nr:hypothetical protein WICPIJ_008025 [Wickerhamomyces pijperi]